MLRNFDDVCEFLNSTWRVCSRVGGWVSSLIAQPDRDRVSKGIFLSREDISLYSEEIFWIVSGSDVN